MGKRFSLIHYDMILRHLLKLLAKEKGMLLCPKLLLMHISHIIPWDILFNGQIWAFIDRLLNQILTSDLSPFVHGLDYFLLCLLIVNSSHPGSHDMHCTKNNIALLFTNFKTRKSYFDAIGFYITLVRKKISWILMICKLFNYF